MALLGGKIGGLLNKLLTLLKLGKEVGLYNKKNGPNFKR
jgi:hypothetical protein